MVLGWGAQFDLKSLTGKTLRLPTKESAEEAVEGRMVYDGTGAKEACVLAMTKEMEYSHIVPLFPTGDDGRDAAKWLVGKPFKAGFTVAAAATLKAEMSEGAAAAAAKAQAQAADEAEGKKGSKAKGRARKAPKMTAVQEYGVGIHDAVLGEETDRNRSVAEVPLASLWTRWTAVGGQKRSREEQEAQQRQFEEHAREAAAAAEKKAEKKKGRKEKTEEAQDEEVQEPEKKRSRKGTKKHAK